MEHSWGIGTFIVRFRESDHLLTIILITASCCVTEAESIQILNLMPTEPVEIHLMVEDLHSRMSETKQEEFLNMIQSYNSTTNSGSDDDTTQQNT